MCQKNQSGSFVVSVSESRSVVSNSLGPHGLYNPWNSPGQNTGVGSSSLLQGIFPTQESNWGLLHYRQILYQLIYQGNPVLWQDIFNVESLDRERQKGGDRNRGGFTRGWERTGKSEQDVGTAKTQFLWILGSKGLNNIFCIFIYFILKIIANFLSFEVQV